MSALAAAALTLVCAAVDGDGSATLSLAGEIDSNARRQATLADSAPPPGDALVRAQLVGTWIGTVSGARVLVDGALGGKLFVEEAGERMLVGQVRASGERALPFGFVGRASFFSKARAQRSGARTWALERGEVELSRSLAYGFALFGGMGGDVFASWDAALFSSSTGNGVLGVAYAFTPRERLETLVDVGVRAFPLLASSAETPSIPRLDLPLRLQLAFTSGRAVYIQALYMLLRNQSNARGESFTRHRAFGVVGLRAPFDIVVAGQLGVQVTQYDDGISLGQQLFLADDDEGQNSAELVVAKPWHFGVTVEARFAWYGNELAKERLSFSRTTASLGLRMAL
jgi:hypothetical protein